MKKWGCAGPRDAIGTETCHRWLIGKFVNILHNLVNKRLELISRNVTVTEYWQCSPDSVHKSPGDRLARCFNHWLRHAKESQLQLYIMKPSVLSSGHKKLLRGG